MEQGGETKENGETYKETTKIIMNGENDSLKENELMPENPGEKNSEDSFNSIDKLIDDIGKNTEGNESIKSNGVVNLDADEMELVNNIDKKRDKNGDAGVVSGDGKGVEDSQVGSDDDLRVCSDEGADPEVTGDNDLKVCSDDTKVTDDDDLQVHSDDTLVRSDAPKVTGDDDIQVRSDDLQGLSDGEEEEPDTTLSVPSSPNARFPKSNANNTSMISDSGMELVVDENATDEGHYDDVIDDLADKDTPEKPKNLSSLHGTLVGSQEEEEDEEEDVWDMDESNDPPAKSKKSKKTSAHVKQMTLSSSSVSESPISVHTPTSKDKATLAADLSPTITKSIRGNKRKRKDPTKNVKYPEEPLLKTIKTEKEDEMCVIDNVQSLSKPQVSKAISIVPSFPIAQPGSVLLNQNQSPVLFLPRGSRPPNSLLAVPIAHPLMLNNPIHGSAAMPMGGFHGYQRPSVTAASAAAAQRMTLSSAQYANSAAGGYEKPRRQPPGMPPQPPVITVVSSANRTETVPFNRGRPVTIVQSPTMSSAPAATRCTVQRTGSTGSNAAPMFVHVNANGKATPRFPHIPQSQMLRVINPQDIHQSGLQRIYPGTTRQVTPTSEKQVVCTLAGGRITAVASTRTASLANKVNSISTTVSGNSVTTASISTPTGTNNTPGFQTLFPKSTPSQAPPQALPSCSSSSTRAGYPQHQPPTPPEGLDMGADWRSRHNFTCRECGDTFLFRSSLRQHLERRSMLVNYFCPHCKKKLAFVNKCACKNHRLLHKAESLPSTVSGSVQYSGDSAIVTVLPAHMMPQRPKPPTPPPPELETVQPPPPTAEEAEPAGAGDGRGKAKERGGEGEEKEVEEEGGEKAEGEGKPEETEQEQLTKKIAKSMFRLKLYVTNKTELAEQLESMPEIVTAELKLGKPRKCTECDKMQANASRRGRHFRARYKNWQTLFRCDRCLMLLPNPCAFKAHTRIHDKTGPYVCPACGEVFKGDRSYFLRHIKLKCMHFYQKYQVCCPFCTEGHNLGDPLEKHVMSTHVDCYYKCTQCPLAYRTEPGLEKHSREIHQSVVKSKGIYRCPCCEQILHSLEDVKEHVQKRIAKNTEKNVSLLYQCPYCEVFNSASSHFRRHLLMKHGIYAVDEMCGECGAESRMIRDHHIHRVCRHTDLFERIMESKSDKKLPPTAANIKEILASPPLDISRSPSVEKAILKSTEKKRRISNSSETSSHSSEKQPKVRRMCFPEVGKDKSVESFAGQCPTAPPPKARHPCSECNLKFIERSEAQLHMQETHGIAPTFPCHLCANTYTSRSQLDAHIKCTHEGRIQTLPFLCFICQEKDVTVGFKKRMQLEKHLLLAHKISKNQIDYSRLLPATDLTEMKPPDTPEKKLRAGEGVFSCAKCHFTAVERDDFVGHIVKHRSSSSSPQCEECGLCFMVLPALKRHLLIVHKIREFDKYMANVVGESFPSPAKSKNPDHHHQQLPRSTPQSPTNPTSLKIQRPRISKEEKEERRKERASNTKTNDVQPLEALTCNVCYKTFDESGKLRTHMRTHGMAFIKSKRSKVHQWFDD